MTDLDLDDLYRKTLSAVKQHWGQKYIISEEKQRAFLQQFNLNS